MRLIPLAFIVVFLLFFGVFYMELSKNSERVENDTSPTVGMAVIDLERETYKVGDNLTLVITNTGSETIIVSALYRLYRLENGSWKEIETGFTFTMIGWAIPPGGNWTQTVPLAIRVPDGAFGKLEPLSPGRYRITKTVLIERGKSRSRSDEITLSAEFEIVRR
ncbi:immunoglobulin-like domain-containing protein [Thermococcus stetteri]|uniref:immunoglobulin-like domain-containing protein n=1 Tax=Thermococcus stetteri TaxID=49900 RepID=UPI001AEB9C03|nr:immunoglobulin-like domain-containing protein [Thermococcus stetteri]MBP1912646.1 hypothetical protein [Thermococcus stetteri]